jgi:hypothetical protein
MPDQASSETTRANVRTGKESMTIRRRKTANERGAQTTEGIGQKKYQKGRTNEGKKGMKCEKGRTMEEKRRMKCENIRAIE